MFIPKIWDEAGWPHIPGDRGGHEASLALEIDILDRSKSGPDR